MTPARECRPPEGTPKCWFCRTGRGPICDDCIDGADEVLDEHFSTPIAELPHE